MAADLAVEFVNLYCKFTMTGKRLAQLHECSYYEHTHLDGFITVKDGGAIIAPCSVKA